MSDQKQDKKIKDQLSASEVERKKKKNFRKKLMSYFLNSVVVIAAVSVVYFYQPDINKPLPYPRIHSRYTLTNDTLFQRMWGTYRPWVYFGIGTRITREFFFDLMWFKQDQSTPRVRYNCDDNDQLTTYMWTEHEGARYATQLIRDSNLNITTQFLKGPTDDGSSWSVRVRGESHDPSETYSFIFLGFGYYGSGKRELHIDEDSKQFMVRGTQIYYNDYQIYNSPPVSQNKVQLHYMTNTRQPANMVKSTVLNNLKKRRGEKIYTLPGVEFTPEHRLDMLGLASVQFTAKTPFEIDIHSVPFQFQIRGSPPPDLTWGPGQLTKQLDNQSNQFQGKFDRIFGLSKKGYSPEEIEFGQVALSSLIGGIGFFFGRSLVSAPHHEGGYIQYGQARLITGTPARAKFARGFLWDEGFHLLLVAHWSPDLALEILGHWLDLTNADGWIPREQVLGSAARDQIPPEFIVQHNDIANPPTFFLVLESLLRLEKRGVIDSAKFHAFLTKAYPRLRAWLYWYQRTQKGSVTNTYYWRGRDPNLDTELNPKTLASGLDDYPRASHPTDTEKHLDLLCWMALANKIMYQLASAVGEEDDRARFQELSSKLGSLAHLTKHHWDSEAKRFSDYGLHTNDVTLADKSRGPQNVPIKRKVGRKPKLQLVSHFGYVNLFPLLLRQLPADSQQLGDILSSLDNPDQLWTEFGLRSLSKQDPLYRKSNTPTDAPYWRGAVWININYLAVQALQHYSTTEGPHTQRAGELYSRLRINLITNVFNQFQETGYFWEQYDDVTGAGTGAHPFNGWSSLVLLMMAEIY
ncbi:Mannosyl-oligosaccharide glucosidase [Oopsacas minuta]|uniref:Mannosyl-oligosaccharide glucosidase n=1 Tax=Oopsacas minuta TaxID=111878 RepID=A0AAV7JQC2_9METZ|nr:Mannosyl-oligosaccharide glucosidase [Oopsacas minuta]